MIGQDHNSIDSERTLLPRDTERRPQGVNVFHQRRGCTVGERGCEEISAAWNEIAPVSDHRRILSRISLRSIRATEEIGRQFVARMERSGMREWHCNSDRPPRVSRSLSSGGASRRPVGSTRATNIYAAALVSASMTSSTAASTSALSSPSPMTRMTGSVPDGRTSNLPPCPSFFSALAIAVMTDALSIGLPAL